MAVRVVPASVRFPVIVLDCDGVILESTDIKTRAFMTLFRKYPAAVPQIVEYHLAHAGISRFVKIRHVLEHILGRDASPEIVESMAAEFGASVHGQLLTCADVRGLQTFLGWASRRRLFVASGAPDVELADVLATRGLSAHFEGIFGSSRSKRDALRVIADQAEIPPSSMLFVGDSRIDEQAARETGVTFIARICDDPTVTSSPGLPVVADLLELVQILSPMTSVVSR